MIAAVPARVSVQPGGCCAAGAAGDVELRAADLVTQLRPPMIYDASDRGRKQWPREEVNAPRTACVFAGRQDDGGRRASLIAGGTRPQGATATRRPPRVGPR